MDFSILEHIKDADNIVLAIIILFCHLDLKRMLRSFKSDFRREVDLLKKNGKS